MFTVDLHSHILPGIDDGAPDAEVSLALLREEVNQGINQVVLTPHFSPHNETVEEFVQRRGYAWGILQHELQRTDLCSKIGIRRGAEIRYSSSLADMAGLDALCFSGTRVLLIEFSPQHHPEFIEEVIYRLQMRGFVVLLAHVERFPWLRKDLDFLYRLVCSGVYAQFNADSVLNGGEKFSFIQNMLKCGLVHGIGSDTHNIDVRPPYIREAGTVLSKKAGAETVSRLNQFSLDLLAGKLPDTDTPEKPKKGFFDFLRK